MDFLSGCAYKLGQLFADATIEQARYLFRFNSIVEELLDREAKLKTAQVDINERVKKKEREHRAIEIKEDVAEWQKNVDKELVDVGNLKAKIDEKESCLHGLCPNWGYRYWLGRKAAMKTSILSKYLQDHGEFSTIACPKPLPSDRELPTPSCFSPFETTKSACNQIIEALKRESTKMVGLHGLGGVGKTTLAKFVGNQLRQQKIFDEVGIATLSQNPKITDVQRELVKSLGWALTEEDEKASADRIRFMFSESKSRKILIILDDVWNPLDLEKKLGIPIGDRDNCCKILLTTRKEFVCDSLGCDKKIPLHTLTPEEGLTLLKRNAGIDVNDSTLDDVSKQVADECKGLPLAIEAVGSALRGKGFAEWNLALNKLRHAQMYEIEDIGKDDQGVYVCLKFSYDALKGKDSKSCFLLCSLFPEDYKIDLEDLVGYALVLDWYDYEDDLSIEYARTLLSGTINELKAASLLLDTGKDRSVKMHDIVRDVALWMGSKDKIYFTSKVGIRLAERALDQYRGISLVGNKKEELPYSLVCPNLHILRLENTVYKYRLPVPEHFFTRMPALKVVTIIRGDLSLKSLQFLNNLQVLQLIRCDVRDASFLGQLNRLQLLYLESSPIEIPEELGGELSRLKLLHIDIGFIISHNLVPSIDERGLNKLNYLSVQNCKNLECIMDASQLPHGKSGNHEMLSRLAELYLRDLPELKWIWKAPAQHLSLQTLTELTVYGCNNLTYIFTLSQARSLVQLKSLKVSGCKKLEFIIEAKFDHNEGEISVGDGNTTLKLPFLRELSLKYLPQLSSFCSENCHSIWLALEELHLVRCPNLTINSTDLKANLQYLGEKLRILKVDGCFHLRDTIPALLKQGLKKLEELIIRELGMQVVFQLEAIIADGQENKPFPCLKELELTSLEELQVLLDYEGPTHIFSLQNLTIISVFGCTKLRHLFSSTLARNLLQLEELDIQQCLELEQIIDEDEDHLQPVCFPKLRTIIIASCPKLKRLFHISVAPSLQKLNDLQMIANVELEEVFWHKDGADIMDYNEIVMNELRRLILVHLPNLTNFWPAGNHIPFPSVYSEVRHCPKLHANSEGENDSENSGAESLQTTNEEDANQEGDANEDASEED